MTRCSLTFARNHSQRRQVVMGPSNGATVDISLPFRVCRQHGSQFFPILYGIMVLTSLNADVWFKSSRLRCYCYCCPMNPSCRSGSRTISSALPSGGGSGVRCHSLVGIRPLPRHGPVPITRQLVLIGRVLIGTPLALSGAVQSRGRTEVASPE